MPDSIVATDRGPVRGRSERGALVFQGIPYAAPPAGRGRFEAPVPHRPWRDVLDATRPGPTAPQPERRGFGALDMTPFFGPGWVSGHDYLTVDVWAPSSGTGRPVVVFVHGGGFVAGSARASLYGGHGFARDGVVLVTVNYRLGIAGFLQLAGAPANRGLLDVMAALRWVAANIAAFGGDPDNVTLVGQSAGATMVGALAATPAVSAQVRRAIVQSGSGLGAFSHDQAALVADAVATALGVAPTVDGFATLPDRRLVDVVADVMGLDLRVGDVPDPLVGLSPFSLALDRQPAESIAAGCGGDIGLLVGTNAEEGNLYLAPGGEMERSTERDVRNLATRVHPDSAAVTARHRAANPTATHGELRSAILGDALFGRGTDALVSAHRARSTAATHRYEFAWRSSALNGRLGAAHTVELPFVFDCTDLPELRGARGLLGADGVPAALAAEMHGAWVAYASTGDPGWEPTSTHRFTDGH